MTENEMANEKTRAKCAQLVMKWTKNDGRLNQSANRISISGIFLVRRHRPNVIKENWITFDQNQKIFIRFDWNNKNIKYQNADDGVVHSSGGGGVGGGWMQLERNSRISCRRSSATRPMTLNFLDNEFNEMRSDTDVTFGAFGYQMCMRPLLHGRRLGLSRVSVRWFRISAPIVWYNIVTQRPLAVSPLISYDSISPTVAE